MWKDSYEKKYKKKTKHNNDLLNGCNANNGEIHKWDRKMLLSKVNYPIHNQEKMCVSWDENEKLSPRHCLVSQSLKGQGGRQDQKSMLSNSKLIY